MKSDAAERLRQLEAEVQRLKEQMSASPEPAGEPPPEPEGPEEEQAPPKELTPQEQAEVDNLIKQAQLAKIRKQNSVATDLLKKAAAMAPGSAIVLEALGDDLMDRRIFRSAKEAYAKALKLDPTNIALDKKHGQAVYESDARGASLSMDLYQGPVAGGTASIWMSIFMPGVGQMVRGKWFKGILIFCGVLVSLAIFIALGKATSQKAQPSGFSMFWPLGLALFFWVWGFLDSQGGAKHVSKRQINRPTPPVDLPFE